MDEQRINFLSDKLLKGEITGDEIQEFDEWYNASDGPELKVASDQSRDALGLRLFSLISSGAGLRKPKAYKINLWYLSATAAAIVILFSVRLFYQNPTVQDKKVENLRAFSSATSGATLTLSSGKKILLSAVANGALANEAGVVISKAKDGSLIYSITDQPGHSLQNLANNKLSTSRGQTYKVRLPDGSLVWLNAASSIEYPSSFAGARKRNLFLIGEAYFEIEKDSNHPFVVKTANQSVTVLGTHFNISSYPEDPNTNTTLIEGSVKISSSGTNSISAAQEQPAVILKPGQLATFAGGKLNIKAADVEVETAWKNGEFRFRNERLESVMRKISRWYNLEIEYKNSALRDERFGGTISKFGDVTDVLHMLELTGSVHFTLAGRRITVY